MEYSYIKKAEYQEPFQIYCEFEDGKTGYLELQPYLKATGIFAKLSDENFARKFQVQDGVLTWGDGEIDIAPETVYHQVTGLPLPAWMEK